MASQTLKNKYCFDSSVFIDGWRRNYPFEMFQPLWENVGEGIINGRVLVPHEVKKEILSGTDELVKWFKRYNAYIIPISIEQINIVRKIVNQYQAVSQYKKPRPNHADPFVVAVAELENCIVVTYETPNGSDQNPAIPDLCRERGIPWLSFIELFKQEGWKFNIM
jgi:hypothetical protein